jgi:aminoglycoside phosphotransferase family enzyme
MKNLILFHNILFLASISHKSYLIPRYVSKNRFLAIQRKAITSASIRKKLVEIDKEVSESIKKIRVKAETHKKTLKLLSQKISVRKIPGTIPDLHNGNIGMIDGKVMVIDLNNQYDSL